MHLTYAISIFTIYDIVDFSKIYFIKFGETVIVYQIALMWS